MMCLCSRGRRWCVRGLRCGLGGHGGTHHMASTELRRVNSKTCSRVGFGQAAVRHTVVHTVAPTERLDQRKSPPLAKQELTKSKLRTGCVEVCSERGRCLSAPPAGAWTRLPRRRPPPLAWCSESSAADWRVSLYSAYRQLIAASRAGVRRCRPGVRSQLAGGARVAAAGLGRSDSGVNRPITGPEDLSRGWRPSCSSPWVCAWRCAGP